VKCLLRQIPLDAAVLDEWARLKDLSHRHGWNVTDDDLGSRA